MKRTAQMFVPALDDVDHGLSSKWVSVPGSTIPMGEYAPAFVLPRSDVGSFGFAELLGTPSVLYFYSGSGDDCSQQSAILADLSPRLARLGVALVGIIAAEPSAISVYCRAILPTFPLLCDWEPRALVSRLYGFNREKAAPAISATYLIDARGVIRWICCEDGDRPTNGAKILGAVRTHLLRPFPVGPVD
ncbi:peroxiredoxin family protein [Rhizobium sp. Leaf306]|uniref:peroxiredoxin family protein n=1 Tax=Rhizobium sp. Leaf306 TaxID=1736330 RepID=UPI0009EAEFE8|nr:peroxiredoxin family protein [Rhizobium sp. Leaf306]